MAPVSWIPFAFPGVAGVGCAFTTRQGGAGQGPYAHGNLSLDVGDDPGHVAMNRRQLLDGLGLDRWLELEQVHGTDLVVDPPAVEHGSAPDPSPARQGDGLATSRPGAALVIKTADCQPILLAHCSGKYVAALHCGWRGNREGFPVLGVERFCASYGFPAAEVLAVRGPSLSPAKSEFLGFEREFGPHFAAYFDPQTRTVDLWGLTRDQLLRAGLCRRNIFSLDLCTYSLAGHFFSYRREKQCGRQAGLVWIKA